MRQARATHMKTEVVLERQFRQSSDVVDDTCECQRGSVLYIRRQAPGRTIWEIRLRRKAELAGRQFSQGIAQTHRTAHEHDGVGINGSADTTEINFARNRVSGNEMNLDAKVLRRLLKSGMSRFGYNPIDFASVLISPHRPRVAHISGSVMPRSALARSRYALHAIKIDSVPPEVVVPAPPD